MCYNLHLFQPGHQVQDKPEELCLRPCRHFLWGPGSQVGAWWGLVRFGEVWLDWVWWGRKMSLKYPRSLSPCPAPPSPSLQEGSSCPPATSCTPMPPASCSSSKLLPSTLLTSPPTLPLPLSSFTSSILPTLSPSSPFKVEASLHSPVRVLSSQL